MQKIFFLTNPNRDELNQIIALYKSENWWAYESDSSERINKIISGSHSFVVAIENDKIIGMGRAISDGASDAYIQDVAVQKDFRGKSIGTSIIKELVLKLRSDGIGWIGLIAEKGSHHFYESIGFDQMDDSTPMLLSHLKAI